MQDAALERTRGHPTRRLETHEFRIGRLKHERVTVPRGEQVTNINNLDDIWNTRYDIEETRLDKVPYLHDQRQIVKII